MIRTWPTRFVAAIVLCVCANTTLASIIDTVRVEKSERKMYLESENQVIRSYDVSLGDSPEGHKTIEGDEKTPEGRYVLNWRNPKSKYHLSIHISYPNAADEAQARRRGVSPGGAIFIHGLPNGFGLFGRWFRGRDWTDGCIAVNSNAEMQEIWDLVPDGTPIIINP